VLSVISGAVTGLVVITPGSGYVNCQGALVMGFIGGVVCYFSIQLKHKLGYDDALDAFGVHGVGGLLGGVLTGIFADPKARDGVPPLAPAAGTPVTATAAVRSAPCSRSAHSFARARARAGSLLWAQRAAGRAA